MQNTTGAENKEQPRAQVAVPVEQREISPLTPLLPGDETPVEDGSTTEEPDSEEEPDKAGKSSREEETKAWHKNTRPAESPLPKKNAQELSGKDCQMRLDQLAYLTLWMRKSTETRKMWEKAEPNEEHDAIVLAGKIQDLDVQLGEGATVSCIKSQLVTWGDQEPAQMENGETAPDTQQLTIPRQ